MGGEVDFRMSICLGRFNYVVNQRTPNAMTARVGMHSKVHDMRIVAKICDNAADDMPIQFRNPDILLRHVVGDTLCHGRQAKMHVGCIGCNQTSRQRIHIF